MVKLFRKIENLTADVVAEGSKVQIGPVPWGRGFRVEMRTEDNRLVAIVGPFPTYAIARYHLASYALTVRQ